MNRMKRFLFGVLTMILLAGLVACSSNDNANEANNANDASGNGETISIGVTPWTSTVPPTKIASLILQDMGYEVEEVEAEAGNIYAGLSQGSLDVFMDSWFPNQKHYVEKYEDKIEAIAVSYDDADSGLVVPTYMEDINDVGDLKGKEDLFDNVAYTIEEGDPAMENLQKVIEKYELDIEQVNSSEGAMLAQAEKLIAQEKPVLFYGWRPHSMFTKYDAKILTNEKVTEYFSGSSVNIIVNKELAEKAPEVYQFFENWSISIDDVEEMIANIDDGADPEEEAQKWIDNNQDKVNEMLGK